MLTKERNHRTPSQIYLSECKQQNMKNKNIRYKEENIIKMKPNHLNKFVQHTYHNVCQLHKQHKKYWANIFSSLLRYIIFIISYTSVSNVTIQQTWYHNLYLYFLFLIYFQFFSYIKYHFMCYDFHIGEEYIENVLTTTWHLNDFSLKGDTFNTKRDGTRNDLWWIPGKSENIFLKIDIY